MSVRTLLVSDRPLPCKNDHPHQEFSLTSRRSISTELHGSSTKFSDLDKFPTLSTFSCWWIRFKTQVSACSGSPSEAMLRIQEVEMVDSVDDFKSSHSIQGYAHFLDFEMLDARIASALNKIIQNSHFKKKVSLEEQRAQKEDRFLLGRQVAFMIHGYFRVTGARDTVLDYADFFSVTLRNDNVQDFDMRWDEILLSMTKIPSDDFLESLYKLRVRESAQRKTVLEL